MALSVCLAATNRELSAKKPHLLATSQYVLIEFWLFWTLHNHSEDTPATIEDHFNHG